MACTDSAIAAAIWEAEALGFIRVSEHPRGENAFYLTFHYQRGINADPPTHDWSAIKTMEDAERIAAKARNAKTIKKGRRRKLADPAARPWPPPPGVGRWLKQK